MTVQFVAGLDLSECCGSMELGGVVANARIRILVADDSDIIRRAIITILSREPDLEVCGEASSGSESLQKACELRPDVVVIDVSLPDLSGLQTARLIRNELSDNTKIIVISQNDPDLLRTGAKYAMADTSIEKSRLGTDLVPTIRKWGGAAFP